MGQKKAGVAILISYKIDFEIKRQRKTLHNDQRINPRRRYNNYKYICTQNRNTTILKLSANKNEREINNNKIIVGNFNNPLTPMDTLNRKLTRKQIFKRHNGPCRPNWTFHPQKINFTFFSSAHRTISRIDHILGHKSSLGKYKKKIEIIPVIFSDHNAIR